MEMRRSRTRAAVLAWTPAPEYSSSPSNSNESQLSWDEGGYEDFQSQMDENGIIGLRESQEVDDEEVALEKEEDLLFEAGTPEPEEGPPPALEDLSCHLSELLDSEPFSQPTADDCSSPSHNDDDSLALADWSDYEDGQKPHEEHTASLKIQRPVRDGVRGMADAGTGEAEGHRDASFSLQRDMNPTYNWLEEDDGSKERNNNMTTLRNHRATSETPTCSQNDRAEELVLTELLHFFSPLSSKNTPHAPVLPYLPLISPENKSWNFGPEASKTFTDQGSSSSQLGCTPKTSQPRFGKEQCKDPNKITPQLGSSNRVKERSKSETKAHQSHCQPPIPVPRKIKCAPQESCQSISPAQQTAVPQSSSTDSSPLNTPHYKRHRGHRPSPTDLKDVRKGQLSHALPDFSKVEPRVRLPKSDYKPPISRRPPRKRDSRPEASLMYKSPADIVREVLLSSTEGLSDTAAPGGLQRSVNRTVPEEFRCPLQASKLVEQLQEDYNRLLTKYAEAENTIDRLRLEAKVSLHCVSPKPSQSTLSGVLHKRSKVISMSFPQAQRAELSTNTAHSNQEKINSEASRGTPTCLPSVDSVSSRGPLSFAPVQLSESLSNHAQRFQLQLDELEKLLKSGKLKPDDQTQLLSELVQGQDCLERDYLAAREHYQQMQTQTRGKSAHFDPERELESQIFNSGLQLEELKERIEQSEQNQLKSESGHSPRPHAHQQCASLNETEPQPENPVSAVPTEDRVELEVSSVDEESNGDGAEDKEEIIPSVFHPLHQKHQLLEKDFSNLMNHYQSFRELPKRLDTGPPEPQRVSHPCPATNDRTEEEKLWRTKDDLDSIEIVHLSTGSTDSKETLNMAPLPATGLPEPQDIARSPSGISTSHSNLGQSAVLKKRASKECDMVLKAPLEDGIVSPETDSGFVGSVSSRLTPAARSHIQQRAAVRPSVTQETCTIKPETVSVSGQPALGSQAHTQASPARSGGAPGSTGRGGQTGRRYLPSPSTSSSPLRWPSGHLQHWPSSGISELERQSDSAQSLSGEEARQDDQCTQPANQNGSYLRSTSSAVPHRHGDQFKAQSSVQLTNRHKALQSLQVEVDRLREHLEGSLRMTSPPSPVRASHSLLEDFRNHKPSHTSTPLQPNFRPLDPRASSKRASRGSRRSEEEGEEKRSMPRPRRRSASLPRFRTELDITTDSEHAQSDPKPRTSRYIPVIPLAHASHKARAESKPYSRNQSEEGDKEAEGNRGALCMSCKARQSSRTSERPVRNIMPLSSTGHYSGCCPLCGASQTQRASVPPPVNQSSIPRDTRPASPIHWGRGSIHLAAAPSPPTLGSVHVVQYVPVCPTVLYCTSPVAPSSYPKSFYLSCSGDRGHKSGVRDHHRRSHSVDTQHSLSSLDRAINAARSMREVSRRMTRSLASGLHRTSLLSQSCTY